MDSEKYLYRPTKLAALPDYLLSKLTLESRGCIERLIAHDEPASIEYVLPLKCRQNQYNTGEREELMAYSFGPVKQAAVLVALYQRAGGEMEVILSTRAKHLRRHPSQTVCSLAQLAPSPDSG